MARVITLLLIISLPSAILVALSVQNAEAKGVFLTVAILWFSELLPLAVTGLLIPVLITVLAIMPAKAAFANFGNEIIFLFLGCFFLAKAMEKHRLHLRLAYYFLSIRWAASSAASVTACVALFSWIISMWISNTAACAMLVPICLGIVEVYRPHFDETVTKNFTLQLLITMAFAASIGGLATPIGSPPNLIAIGLLEERGIAVSFLGWMSVALPCSLFMLAALIFLIRRLFPVPKSASQKQLQHHFRALLRDLGPLKREEMQVMFAFSCAVALWTLPEAVSWLFPGSRILESIADRLPLGVGAIAATTLLFMLPASSASSKTNLTWSDSQDIDWGTLFLFGGGLTLGAMLEHTGVAREINTLLFTLGGNSLAVTVLLIVVVSLLTSEFASNTAAASIMIPVLLGGLGVQGQDMVLMLTLACVFGSSFGFMLPVSTPPNAIIFGTKKVPRTDLLRAGVFFDLLGIAITMIAFFTFWPIVLPLLAN
ncbi:MAG: DASS family sodium-coupled anion symporter [Deltaproteobacteria bacterium]|nr:DASS family sodium-coupled anion symporter [Deltaproteobacteria bacterium]